MPSPSLVFFKVKIFNRIRVSKCLNKFKMVGCLEEHGILYGKVIRKDVSFSFPFSNFILINMFAELDIPSLLLE